MGALGAITRVFFTECCPCILGGGLYPLLDASNTVKGRADVQGKDGGPIGFWGRGVVVDDIANFLTPLPTDDPVVAVKWWFSAMELVRLVLLYVVEERDVLETRREQPPSKQPEASLWRQLPRTSLEACELGVNVMAADMGVYT